MSPLGTVHSWETNAPSDLTDVPDWDDNSIDYIIFESEILGNSPNTISGEISGVRLWHFLAGMPDFTLGDGRYTQVLESVRRNSRVSRKIPSKLEMLSDIAAHRNPDNPQGVGIACAEVVGFFFLLRVGELGGLRRADASLFIDDDGAHV